MTGGTLQSTQNLTMEPPMDRATGLDLITQNVRKLAVHRTKLAAHRAEYQAKFAEWEAQNAELIANMRNESQLVESTDLAVRNCAVAYFHGDETRNKKIVPGVEIKMRSSMTYPPADALAWAKETGLALVLDAKTFEKIAASTDIPFVKKHELPQAQIATDLNKLLGS
jgi:hypothetical protein